MPRQLLGHMEDAIEANARYIRQYAQNGEVFLGAHPKSRMTRLRSRLSYLKQYAYHRMQKGDEDKLATAVVLVFKGCELDWEPEVKESPAGEKMFRVYWRTDRVAAALAAEGIEDDSLSETQKGYLAEARQYLLDYYKQRELAPDTGIVI